MAECDITPLGLAPTPPFKPKQCETNFKATITFLKHFQAKQNDIIVVSLPKSSTTWLKALAFATAKRNRFIPISQNDDHPLLHSNPHSLVPFLETIDFHGDDPNNIIFPHLSTLSEPRLFGTHIPFPLLPHSIHDSNCKIIYICRNPFDAFISLWHFKNNILSSQPLLPALTLEEAFENTLREHLTMDHFGAICWAIGRQVRTLLTRFGIEI
ncbi:cytosolic sulfotransferase 15-like [Senna tora]|uniref:Sulfotransferase n=1 Tax=Senna tora TaxID=362788 RepID=A0A834T5H2_9FABA|nr:cytosolic sulfotransferase 15-like [Senna tora]